MDRPILFSAPMVRALLAGTKTQTRRLAKIEPDLRGFHIKGNGGGSVGVPEIKVPAIAPDYMPNQPGDRLWVKENGWQRPERTPQMMRNGADTWEPYYFDADCTEQDHADFKAWGFKRRPSIHMPRVFSRITLHVTDVRVQRLQDISEEDALAEGISFEPPNVFTIMDDEHEAAYAGDTARECYAELWAGINGQESWDANPWVAAYTFTVERANIDQARAA